MKLKTLILPAVMALVLGNVAFAGTPAQDGMKADNAAPAVSVKEDTQAGMSSMEGKGAPAKATPKQVAHKAKHHKKHAKAKKVAKKAAPKAAAKPAK